MSIIICDTSTAATDVKLRNALFKAYSVNIKIQLLKLMLVSVNNIYIKTGL